MITNALEDKPLPVYGDGMNVRDWLYVEDNCAAIDLVLHRGREGEIYNIGAGNEYPNIQIVKEILRILGKPESLIKFVEDRPGHDFRYSVDWSKVKSLGFEPKRSFKEALEETVTWYRENEWWWRPLKK
jgi:dTDP-glucose 4,6-dehydratase